MWSEVEDHITNQHVCGAYHQEPDVNRTMNNLKLSLLWTVLYLAAIFVLGLMDNIDRPIINFASYFYLSVLVAFPVTVFFPFISRASPFVPLLVWVGIYLVVLEVVDREPSTKSIEFTVIVLEFILLELGVWLAYRLAVQISQAESVLDALALGAFPSRVHNIDQEQQRIKIEFSRSRRYLRPLSLVVIESGKEDEKTARELIKSVQHDLSLRFRNARVCQIIDDRIRQTDLLLRDYGSRFVILCSETDGKSAVLLAERISNDVKARTDLPVLWGVASYPDDAITFDDLLLKASQQLTYPDSAHEEQTVSVDPR